MKIEVSAPIKRPTIKRNEAASIMSKRSTGISVSGDYRQRASYVLRNVDYRIYVRMAYIPVRNRSASCQKHCNKECNEVEYKAENLRKYQEVLERRVKAGQYFTTPYLGCREFTCALEYMNLGHGETSLEPKPTPESRDPSIILYDMDFERDRKNPPVMFYHAQTTDGVILVPSMDNNEILR